MHTLWWSTDGVGVLLHTTTLRSYADTLAEDTRTVCRSVQDSE